MKIISWNCNGALRKKFEALEKLKADILIIQECEDPSQTKALNYINWAGEHLWVGKTKHKGIGIFARNGYKLKSVDLDSGDLKIFLPFTVNDNLNVLAVWTQGSDSGEFRYIGQMWQYLQKHKEYLKKDKHLIIGDFNSNKIWDRKHDFWTHSNVIRELEEIGISSLYHLKHQCDQGEELHPTFYMYRKIEKPYHIDYAFLSNTLTLKSRFEIGQPAGWLELSDHMPLIINLELIT